MEYEGILNLNFDVYSRIIEFLSVDELYCFKETCKYFLELIKKLTNLKNTPNYLKLKYCNPHISVIVRSINLIEWAKTHKSFRLTYNCLNFVAREGDLDILKYIINNYFNEIKGEYFEVNPQILYEASKNGHINIIKWLYKNKYNYEVINASMAVSGAIQYGNLNNVKWLIEHNFKYNKEDVYMAGTFNRVNILKYLLEEKNCEWDEYLYNYAAKNGSLNVLKYLYKYSYNDLSMPTWSSSTISSAAKNGHLKIIKYLRKKNCPWNEYTIIQAAIDSNYNFQKRKTLKWCIDNNCSISEELFNIFSKIGFDEFGLNNYTKKNFNIINYN